MTSVRPYYSDIVERDIEADVRCKHYKVCNNKCSDCGQLLVIDTESRETSTPVDDSDCEHIEIYEDTCQDCGAMFQNMIDTERQGGSIDPEFENTVSRKREKFSYKGELSRLENIDPEVLEIVNEKIKQMKPQTHIRLTTHKKTLFIFIYMAYNSLGKAFDPKKLGQNLGLTDKQVRLAIKTASEGDSQGSSNPICTLPPQFYFSDLAEKIKSLHVFTTDQLERLSNFSSLILSANEMMFNERPVGIAATIIKMFLEWNKKMSSEFYSSCRMTQGYIKSVEALILTTLNDISEEILLCYIRSFDENKTECLT